MWLSIRFVSGPKDADGIGAVGIDPDHECAMAGDGLRHLDHERWLTGVDPRYHALNFQIYQFMVRNLCETEDGIDDFGLWGWQSGEGKAAFGEKLRITYRPRNSTKMTDTAKAMLCKITAYEVECSTQCR